MRRDGNGAVSGTGYDTDGLYPADDRQAGSLSVLLWVGAASDWRKAVFGRICQIYGTTAVCRAICGKSV